MTDYSWHIPDPATQPEFYADIPLKRLIAWGIDTVVVILICLLILPFTAFTGLFFLPFLFFTVGFAYRVVTLARGSATWGMWLVAIEFRRVNGTPFDLGTAFMHTAGFTLSMVAFLFQVLSIVLMLTGPRAQGLTDHLLGTVALNRKAGR